MNEETTTTNNTNKKERHRVLALYKFCTIPPEKIHSLKQEIESTLRNFKTRGTILLACEGINGTICYPEHLTVQEEGERIESSGTGTGVGAGAGVDSVVEYFQQNEILNGVRTRISFTNTPIFHRLKVKVKKEIVTMTGDDDAKNDSNNNNTGDKEKDEGLEETNDKACTTTTTNTTATTTTMTMEHNPKKKLKKDQKLKVDPTENVGKYVKPGKEWDDLLMDPDVVVIDTRNKYEVEIGTFENAISPCTDNFRQFPDWLHRFSNACQKANSPINKNNDNNNDDDDDDHNDPKNKEQCVINDETVNTSFDSKTFVTNESNHNPRSKDPVAILPKIKRKPKAVAMFCTGGIRCEKSTSYALTANVFDPDVPVYHLDGGILAYLDSHHDPNESKWKGECFVFDQRVALTHGLKPSETYNSCHGCRKPVSDEDKKGKDYLYGVHCKHCKDDVTDSQRQRFEDRQKQMELAKKKGILHIHDSKEVQKEIQS